jgi:hypothetical protein
VQVGLRLADRAWTYKRELSKMQTEIGSFRPRRLCGVGRSLFERDCSEIASVASKTQPHANLNPVFLQQPNSWTIKILRCSAGALD